MQLNDIEYKNCDRTSSRKNLVKAPIDNNIFPLPEQYSAQITTRKPAIISKLNLKKSGNTKNIDPEEMTRAIKNFFALKQQNVAQNKQIFLEATDYLELLKKEKQINSDRFQTRIDRIRSELFTNNSYFQTTSELTYGAKVAWRNSSRCIGRLFWQELIVKDLRHLQTAPEIFAACLEHINSATNGGKIKSIISIFKPGVRILNPFLIRYAGYQLENNQIVGDPASVKFTKFVTKLGWKGKGSAYDLLPLVIHIPGGKPELFELPPEVVMEVDLTHPEYDWFAELNLKWYVLPVVSDKELSIGGIRYTACPFNGWYMGAEIGARNFGDSDRYNMLPVIAKKMGLNTASHTSLWQDRALVELNIAVLHSFAKQGVTIVDHHTASRQFMQHIKREEKLGRTVPADWGWIIPPISPSTTEVFHHEYKNEFLLPNFLDRSHSLGETSVKGCPFHS